MTSDVRYCTTADGVQIAYTVAGDGPAMVLCPAFIESFSHGQLFPEFDAAITKLATGMRLVRFDMRGTGLSQHGTGFAYSNEANASDIEAVARAAGLKKFALTAPAFSGPRALHVAANHPRQVSHLILISTCASLPQAIPESSVRALAGLAETNWEVAAQAFAGIGAAMSDMYKSSMNGNEASRLLLDGYLGADATACLKQIHAPALIIHSRADRFIALQHGQSLAAAMPHARFVVLDENVQASLTSDGENAGLIVREFVLGRDAPRPVMATSSASTAGPSMRAILFTDLVGHSAMMNRLGDEQGRAVLRDHERITRDVLVRNGGREVKTMGDGFMASFDSVVAATQSAIELQRAFAERNETAREPLLIRCGLDAGEPISEGGDLFGAAVILAARAAAQADAGEILIPEPVRHLLAGKGFVFADRGEFLLKGFEDIVRLFEVHWHG